MKSRLYYSILAILGMSLGLFSCQKAPELTITSPASIELSADGNSGSITFTANRDWKVSSSDSWVSISPSSGTASDGPVTVTVRCNANTTYEDRTATVTIRMEELSQSVTVRQLANKGVVLPKQVFDLQSGSNTIEVEVQANVQYTVTTSVSWIKQTGTKGLTSKTLTFSIEENKTYDPREGKITIKPQDSSVQEQVISVKQAQKDALNVEKTSYDMPYGGGEIEIKVKSNVSFDVTPNADWIHYTQTKALSSSTVCLKVDENTTYNSRQGTVEIKQQNGSLKHTISVNQAGRIAVTSISLDKTEIKLKEGETATLIATVKPDNATDKQVTWSSSATNVASVDENGKVTALKEGTATITAKAGEKTATCTVTVKNDVPVSSIELNITELTLSIGDEETLVATVKPDNATEKAIIWTSSDSSVATVDEQGKVTAIMEGSADIMATAGEKFAICIVTVEKRISVPSPIDLGISVKWADFNLGASSPEEYGDYYAWGELKTKEYYSLSNYLWHDNTGSLWTKYNSSSEKGPVDNKSQLDQDDDVAYVKLGGDWRMPTHEEWTELIENCSWSWSTQGGVSGLTFTSKINGNSIFLPAAGYIGKGGSGSTGSFGYYWSSSLYTDNPDTESDYALYGSFNYTPYAGVSCQIRYDGLSIRPVNGKKRESISVTSISLNKPTMVLAVGHSETLVATVKPNDATDKTVTWISSIPTVATVDANGIVTAMKEGTVTITAVAGNKTASCVVTVNQDGISSKEVVNLGLSVKWASYNLGASTPEENGNYYAWGELETKDSYDWSNYKWCDGSYSTLTKYNTSSSYGTVDNLTILEEVDDVAHYKLGGKWRIPTHEEWVELIENCTWTWGAPNGVFGWVITSNNNGNSIFLPAAGSRSGTETQHVNKNCCYWSSSIDTDLAYNAWTFFSSSRFSSPEPGCSLMGRGAGYSIRPVTE